MSTVDRGVKRRCASCEALFYDMLRFPIRCPKCGAEFDATVKSKLVSVPRPPKNRTARTNFSRSTKPAPDKSPGEAEAEEPKEATPEDENEEDDERDVEDADDADDADDAADPAEDDGDDKAAGDR
jgi:hypothetical protein